MLSSSLDTAYHLSSQVVQTLRTATGNMASDDELVSALTVCEATARQLDRIVVDTVAALQRRGVFAERGYKTTAAALGDLLGWEPVEARRRVVAAEQIARGSGWTAHRFPLDCRPPPWCSPPDGSGCGT